MSAAARKREETRAGPRSRARTPTPHPHPTHTRPHHQRTCSRFRAMAGSPTSSASWATASSGIAAIEKKNRRKRNGARFFSCRQGLVAWQEDGRGETTLLSYGAREEVQESGACACVLFLDGRACAVARALAPTSALSALAAKQKKKKEKKSAYPRVFLCCGAGNARTCGTRDRPPGTCPLPVAAWCPKARARCQNSSAHAADAFRFSSISLQSAPSRRRASPPAASAPASWTRPGPH